MSITYLDSTTKYVPQMDIIVQYTENGGIEATQTFIGRKSDLSDGGTNLTNFRRGTTWETLYPEVPSIYRYLKMKVFDPQDIQPGIIAIKATFTGYQYSGNGSSGEEDSVPTASLRGGVEETALSEIKKWTELGSNEQMTLGKILSGTWHYIEDPFTPGSYVVAREGSDGWIVQTGTNDQLTTENAKKFAMMMARGKMTYKKGSWTYNYRTESKAGFTEAQLNLNGKIVANPPGSPVKPSSDWTWLLVGPSQDQSGPERFVKDLSFLLIENNEDNQFLYA
jgi:hypothetical protein